MLLRKYYKSSSEAESWTSMITLLKSKNTNMSLAPVCVTKSTDQPINFTLKYFLKLPLVSVDSFCLKSSYGPIRPADFYRVF